MRLLLDSHAFLWAALDDALLSNEAKSAISNSESAKYLSVASIWELAIKAGLGRLELRSPLADIIKEQEETNGIIVLPIEREHALLVQDLAQHHEDPFDRILVAQCMVGDLTLVSSDATLDAYSIRRIW